MLWVYNTKTSPKITLPGTDPYQNEFQKATRIKKQNNDPAWMSQYIPSNKGNL